MRSFPLTMIDGHSVVTVFSGIVIAVTNVVLGDVAVVQVAAVVVGGDDVLQLVA